MEQGFKMFAIDTSSVRMKLTSEKNNTTRKVEEGSLRLDKSNFEGLSLLFVVCKKPRTCLRLPSGDEADNLKSY